MNQKVLIDMWEGVIFYFLEQLRIHKGLMSGMDIQNLQKIE